MDIIQKKKFLGYSLEIKLALRQDWKMWENRRGKIWWKSFARKSYLEKIFNSWDWNEQRKERIPKRRLADSPLKPALVESNSGDIIINLTGRLKYKHSRFRVWRGRSNFLVFFKVTWAQNLTGTEKRGMRYEWTGAQEEWTEEEENNPNGIKINLIQTHQSTSHIYNRV